MADFGMRIERWISNSRVSHEETVANVRELGQPGVEYLISMLENEEARGRYDHNSAVAILGDLGDIAFEDVLNASEHKSGYVRMGAVMALGGMGDKRAVERLAEMLNNPDEVPLVRPKIPRAMMRIGGEKAVDELLKALKMFESMDIRDEGYDSSTYEEVISALGPLKDKRALKPLLQNVIEKSEDDDQLWVSGSRVGAISDIGGENVLGTLLSYVGDDLRGGEIELVHSLCKHGEKGDRRVVNAIKKLVPAIIEDEHNAAMDREEYYFEPHVSRTLISAVKKIGEIGNMEDLPFIESELQGDSEDSYPDRMLQTAATAYAKLSNADFEIFRKFIEEKIGAAKVVKEALADAFEDHDLEATAEAYMKVKDEDSDFGRFCNTRFVGNIKRKLEKHGDSLESLAKKIMQKNAEAAKPGAVKHADGRKQPVKR